MLCGSTKLTWIGVVNVVYSIFLKKPYLFLKNMQA